MRDVIYVRLDIVYSINSMKLFQKNPIFRNSEIESDHFTVLNSEIISFDFTEKSL